MIEEWSSVSERVQGLPALDELPGVGRLSCPMFPGPLPDSSFGSFPPANCRFKSGYGLCTTNASKGCMYLTLEVYQVLAMLHDAGIRPSSAVTNDDETRHAEPLFCICCQEGSPLRWVAVLVTPCSRPTTFSGCGVTANFGRPFGQKTPCPYSEECR